MQAWTRELLLRVIVAHGVMALLLAALLLWSGARLLLLAASKPTLLILRSSWPAAARVDVTFLGLLLLHVGACSGCFMLQHAIIPLGPCQGALAGTLMYSRLTHALLTLRGINSLLVAPDSRYVW
jgi:hypothetical protein